MRTNGVDERFCTGKDATDWEKFEKWAEAVPYTFRNPLYHWTHLELKTAFGIDKILNPHTAREIYDECNEKLKQPEYSARGMMRRYHVEVVCTTDDPIDSLESDYIFLDEATNSLDANNERSIVENLDKFYKGKTVVIVAHRLSTVKNADQIVVKYHGKVVEVGNHESLTAKRGAYYNLVKNQLELGN